MTIHVFKETDRQQKWFKDLADSLDARLQKLRERNDSDLDERATAELRGRIAILKELQGDMAGRKPVELKGGKVAGYT